MGTNKRDEKAKLLIAIFFIIAWILILTKNTIVGAKEVNTNDVKEVLPMLGIESIVFGESPFPEGTEVPSIKYFLTEEEKIMLQKIALAEAEGEGPAGMVYVMLTVINRKESDDFPDSIEEVIFQHKGENYQFSTVKEGGRYYSAEPNESSKEALMLIDEFVNQGMLYFENPRGKESTWHSRNLTYLFEYKNHVFYK